MDRRFRKARTYSNWCYIDCLMFKGVPRFFQSGDQVEFHDPVYNRLVIRPVEVDYDTEEISDGLSYTRIENTKVFVRVGRRRVRVTEAPPMRIVN